MKILGEPVAGGTVLAGTSGVRAPAEVFDEIFVVFLGLGTLVGVVVVAYTLYNAYRYRYREDEDPAPELDRPELGELPESGGKGKKLFLSFGISAAIVLSLIVWTYASLLYVEGKPTEVEQNGGDVLDVQVEGFQFGWQFTYPNGETTNQLRVPTNRVVNLSVTSRDVFHNFGIPGLRVKSDAIPGQTTNTWFVAEVPANYTANCYEICGAGHSTMDADVVVMEPEAYQAWYENETGASDTDAASESATASNGTTTTANGTATTANGTATTANETTTPGAETSSPTSPSESLASPARAGGIP